MERAQRTRSPPVQDSRPHANAVVPYAPVDFIPHRSDIRNLANLNGSSWRPCDWRLTADALVPAEKSTWDDLAIWTGSVTRGFDRRWYLFYTGVTDAGDRLVQRIGRATSDDPYTWHRYGDKPLVAPDPAWYSNDDTADPAGAAWRDPWVFADPSGRGWHMLITAHAREGTVLDRGIIGHAYSTDLRTWETRPPLTRPAGFGHLETPQVAVVDEQPVLLFSSNLGTRRTERLVWTVPGRAVTGPWDLSRARPVPLPGLYATRLVHNGSWHLMGYVDDRDGEFAGELADPIPVRYTPNGLEPGGKLSTTATDTVDGVGVPCAGRGPDGQETCTNSGCGGTLLTEPVNRTRRAPP